MCTELLGLMFLGDPDSGGGRSPPVGASMGLNDVVYYADAAVGGDGGIFLVVGRVAAAGVVVLLGYFAGRVAYFFLRRVLRRLLRSA